MPENIFEYRQNKSTSQAVAWLLKDRTEKKAAVLVITDAANNFPSIDHTLIVSMLASFGATKQVAIIIRQYLKKRTQFVQIESEKSSKWLPEAGIFAGALVSGILFNVGTALQIIDKPYMSKNADDKGSVLTKPSDIVTWEQTTKTEHIDQL